MKAALYARVSTVEQAENGDSGQDQLRECRELAERQGFKDVAEFVPAGSPDGARYVDQSQAKCVRFIFEKYSEGWSPRKIAAELNDQGVPSPGASWKRTKNRTDGKWPASTIYGDHRRGLGIIHNEIYSGIQVWNRTRSKKQPGSEKRSFFQRPKEEWIRERVPGLESIVSDALWARVRAREDAMRRRYGHRISKCIEQGMRSRTNGGESVRGNRARIKRLELEGWLVSGIQLELRQPKWEEKFKAEVRTALAEASKADNDGQRARRRERLAEAISELRNLIALVKSGLRSDAVGAEIDKLEREVARLEDQKT